MIDDTIKGPVDFDKKRLVLPKDHQPAMVVPRGGAMCANCEYYRPDPSTAHGRCGNPDYKKYYKTDEIPQAPDSYCSDWYKPQDNDGDEAQPAPTGAY